MLMKLQFEQALTALKQGRQIKRGIWKDAFLFLLPAGTVPTRAIHDPTRSEVIASRVAGDTFSAMFSIRMFTEDRKILTGWSPSQADLFAGDWEII